MVFTTEARARADFRHRGWLWCSHIVPCHVDCLCYVLDFVVGDTSEAFYVHSEVGGVGCVLWFGGARHYHSDGHANA